jgi:hypothetical protein
MFPLIRTGRPLNAEFFQHFDRIEGISERHFQEAISMTLAQLEKRVDHLEKLIGKQPLAGSVQTAKAWLARAGAFANDTEYDQMVRLGRKYRQSLLPKPHRAPR